MTFTLNSKEERFIKNIYNNSMKELNDFFKINWNQNTPKIFIVSDRKTINKLKGYKTEDWVVGWADLSDNVFVLDKENYEKESCHNYSDEEYKALIKHELAHLFVKNFCKKGNIKPRWIDEGIATYLSGQNKFKKSIKKFNVFLKYYKTGGKGIYTESGFAINVLIEKHGKSKILGLLSELKNITSKEEFENKFKEIYNFHPTYEEFNRLIGKWKK